MVNILVLNGSPRAPRSNSKRYAELFCKDCTAQTQYCNLSPSNHVEICEKLSDFSDVLLVFPLYADALPVSLLNFLKVLEQYPPKQKPVVSVLINCGFIEHQQNDIAVRMIELFCKQNGYRFGSVLKIGSGEAILDTPFAGLAARKIKRLATSIVNAKYQTLHITMPLTKRMFVRASTTYWVNYGKKNGVTRGQMQTMQIESASR